MQCRLNLFSCREHFFKYIFYRAKEHSGGKFNATFSRFFNLRVMQRVIYLFCSKPIFKRRCEYGGSFGRRRYCSRNEDNLRMKTAPLVFTDKQTS